MLYEYSCVKNTFASNAVPVFPHQVPYLSITLHCRLPHLSYYRACTLSRLLWGPSRRALSVLVTSPLVMFRFVTAALSSDLLTLQNHIVLERDGQAETQVRLSSERIRQRKCVNKYSLENTPISHCVLLFYLANHTVFMPRLMHYF